MTRSTRPNRVERMKTETKTVRANGVDIHYLERGTGAPLVLLHGGMVTTNPIWAGHPLAYASHLEAFGSTTLTVHDCSRELLTPMAGAGTGQCGSYQSFWGTGANSSDSFECEEQDLNLHALRQRNLNPCDKPLNHGDCSISGSPGRG